MKYTYYASDILESAMELAQSKALNSYTFRDCMNWLTELWQQCYERIAQVDEGFYSQTIQLTEKLTHLPAFIKNSVKVYAARDVQDSQRTVFRASSMSDLHTSGTYHISGFDIFCPDAVRRTVWLNYVPEPPFITFTKNNRDPKILKEIPDTGIPNMRYGNYQLSDAPYKLTSMHDPTIVVDIHDYIYREGFDIVSLIVDYPFIFITYEDKVTKDWASYIYKDLLTHPTVMFYNPFDYQGRPSRVKYIKAKWNDYTGMGVIIQDQEDNLIKELGWTPDTIMHYPSPIMRHYLVAHLAKKFADINGSQLMAIENEVASANYELAHFLDVDKSAWVRIDRTTGRSMGDYL